ncbi:hypothetical protein ACFYM3_15990 [Streptomyces massasporeus]|uniref:Response regulatory domain-containing protein n=1 Tax=Streptomyces massasporeus TaxID=67324 RepID=A0ABW6LEF5_9ACTN
MGHVKKVSFRTLIIDDDEVVLRRLAETLRGQSVEVDGRRVEPVIETLKVVVDDTPDGYKFSAETLQDFIDVCRRRYDFIIVDYTYASKSMQPKQWREGVDAKTNLEANDHLLTLVDLNSALKQYDLQSGGKNRARIDSFFAQPSQLLLRSFQHDRKKDKLGPYEQRLDNTKGIFTRCTFHRMDSFQMIYDSDSELRRQFYHVPPNGRQFYRNLVAQLTVLHYRSAMHRFLAVRAGKLLLAKSSFRLSLVTVMVAAVGTFLASLGIPLLQSIRHREFLNVAVFVSVAVIVALVVTFLVTLFVERYVTSRISITED